MSILGLPRFKYVVSGDRSYRTEVATPFRVQECYGFTTPAGAFDRNDTDDTSLEDMTSQIKLNDEARCSSTWRLQTALFRLPTPVPDLGLHVPGRQRWQDPRHLKPPNIQRSISSPKSSESLGT